jgi:hypothetical protein
MRQHNMWRSHNLPRAAVLELGILVVRLVKLVLCIACGLQFGHTPLYLAAKVNHKAMVALLEKGAKVDAGNNVSVR